MFELVITTRNGTVNHTAVRDWNEANAELSRFINTYSNIHPNDSVIDACVLNHLGDRVSRFNGRRLEIFN